MDMENQDWTPRELRLMAETLRWLDTYGTRGAMALLACEAAEAERKAGIEREVRGNHPERLAGHYHTQKAPDSAAAPEDMLYLHPRGKDKYSAGFTLTQVRKLARMAAAYRPCVSGVADVAALAPFLPLLTEARDDK